MTAIASDKKRKPKYPLSTIRTKNGDGGFTMILGEPISKNSPQIHFFGELDEASACLGLIHQCDIVWWINENSDDSELREQIITAFKSSQEMIFILGAIAYASDKDQYFPRLEVYVKQIETVIKHIINHSRFPKLEGFIVPNIDTKWPMLARAVIRRAERQAVACDYLWAIPALNVMSDFLFTIAACHNPPYTTQWTGIHTGFKTPPQSES